MSPKPAKRPPAAEGLEPGDHVYAHHPQRGPIAMRVLACGADGFTGECGQKQRHRLPWARVLGVKARMQREYRVVDQGAEGALVEDARGRRRYVAGELPTELATQPTKPAAAKPAAPKDDPLLDGLDDMRKAQAMELDGPILFLKASAMAGQHVANRPGLVLKDVTDRMGHRTKRWSRSTKDQPQPRRQAQAPMRHGDRVRFRHGEVEGAGKIVASGRDGVTVQDDAGREHQVRHEHLAGKDLDKPHYEARQDGEEDKAYAKRVVDKGQEVKHLPEDHGRYFNLDRGDHEVVPLDKLHSTKTAEENAKGGDNGPKRMLAAAHGALAKRDPITVRKKGDKYHVVDGNGTLESARRLGWKTLPVRHDTGEEPTQDEPKVDTSKPLFAEEEVADLPKEAPQPAKTEADLYEKAAPALEHLKEWLNKGKGIASQLGYTTMTKSPEQVDWATEQGGMLFIAPLKGKARAAEKVEADYGGDWSQLRDVVRCSIAVDKLEELHATLAALKQGGMKLAQKPKDRFAKPVPVGYRDLLMNVTLPNGMIAEVQLHVKAMLAAKSEGHHHYEVERSLDAKAKKGELTSEDQAKLKEAQEAQVAIYGKAWQQISGGGDQPMAKAMRGGAMAQAFKYFERDGAYFRRAEGRATRSVDDVLHGKDWKPYRGADPLEPALFGNEVEDPLAGGDGGEKPMRKAQVLFLKAKLPGTGMGDLFDAPVTVEGHMRGGTYVAPYTSRRKKAAEKPPHPAQAAYDQANEAHRAAHGEFMAATTAYRAGKIGDAEYLAARKKHTDALAAFDAADAELRKPPSKAKAQPAPAAPAAKAPIPERVKDMVRQAVRSAHAHHEGLTGARKLDGGLADPHYEAEYRAKYGTSIAGASNRISSIRETAKRMELADDMEALITEYGGMPDLAATGPIKPDMDAAMLAGLPEGAHFQVGDKPLTTGKVRVGYHGKTGLDGAGSNWHPTKEEAAREARQWHTTRVQREANEVRLKALKRDLAERMLTGAAGPSDAELRTLGLRAEGSSRFDFLSPLVQELFGISKAKVRAAMGDALKRRMSDMGAVTWWADPRKALANAAAYAKQAKG